VSWQCAHGIGTEAENLALFQQVIVLNRKPRSRVRLRNFDRLSLVWLYPLFPSLLDAITIINPETVIRWHRRGFDSTDEQGESELRSAAASC